MDGEKFAILVSIAKKYAEVCMIDYTVGDLSPDE